MPDGIADDSEMPTEVLNALEWPASFSTAPSQMMFDLVMFTFPEEEVLTEKKNQKL